MYSKHERVIITSKDELVIKGKIASISDNTYIIHSNTKKYIAAKYNINKNEAKIIKNDKSEIKLTNLTISKENKISDNNIRIEEINYEEKWILINIGGIRKTLSIDDYNDLIAHENLDEIHIS